MAIRISSSSLLKLVTGHDASAGSVVEPRRRRKGGREKIEPGERRGEIEPRNKGQIELYTKTLFFQKSPPISLRV